jgi:hypothetical protein
MKTLYKNLLMKAFSGPVLICFLLLVAYPAKSQSVSPPTACYGEPLQFLCGGATGCGLPGSTYTWFDLAGAWSITGTGPAAKDPLIMPPSPGNPSPGYHAGVFFLTVQYLPGGLASGMVNVILYTPFYMDGTSFPVSCNGGSNGSIIITPYGGQPGSGGTYGPYAWSNGATSRNIGGLSAGTYTVTVSDANNCKATSSFVVTEPAGMTITGVPVQTTCPDNSNGQISTTVTGGSDGATYLWSNGQTGSAAINLPVGTYTVTVTNTTGCKASSLPIYVGPANLPPEAAGSISGPVFVEPGQTGVLYSVAPIADASIYFWSVPPGALYVSESPGTILVNFSNLASSGNISVYGGNECGNGPLSPNLGITIVPSNILLQNITVGGNTCYDAFHTIYVAGGVSTFVVNEGISVNMIAGQNIIYQPGTIVNDGGYLHGFISTSGQYCTSPFGPVLGKSLLTEDSQTSVPEFVKNQKVHIYPNPANGSFTIEAAAESGMKKVEIFSMNGIRVLSEKPADEHKHTFPVENLRPGVYFIHVTTGFAIEMVKLIKL